MITFLKNNNKGLTLIEILVAFVIGSVMMIAVYSSYTIFAKSYLAIIEKMNVNKSLRNSMSAILRDIRAAGFVDINTGFAKTISNFIIEEYAIREQYSHIKFITLNPSHMEADEHYEKESKLLFDIIQNIEQFKNGEEYYPWNGVIHDINKETTIKLN